MGIIRNTACQVHRFSYDWGNQVKGFALAGGDNTLERFIPRMVRQRKFSDMRGKQVSGPKIFRRFRRFFRRHMDIAPAFIILATIQQGEVNAAEAFSKLSEMRSVSAVAAEENFFEGDSSRKPLHSVLLWVSERPE